MAGEFEKLAYEDALRRLDKQEGLVEELRARTGVLLAASSLAVSFLGQEAFRRPHPAALAILALTSFLSSTATSVLVLMPRRSLTFAGAGASLYESLFTVRGDMAEVYRRLAYELGRAWVANNATIEVLARVYRIATGFLLVQVASLAVLLGSSIA